MDRSGIKVDGVVCQHCGHNHQLLSWQTFANDTKHARADCVSCGGFVKYLPQTPAIIALMADAPTYQPPLAADQPSLFD